VRLAADPATFAASTIEYERPWLADLRG